MSERTAANGGTVLELLPSNDSDVSGPDRPGTISLFYKNGTGFRVKEYGKDPVDLAKFDTPLTTKGDLWTFSTDDARLAVGTTGQVLTVDLTTPTGLKWATGGGGSTSPLTTKGDLWGFSTVDARLPVAANGKVLTTNSGAALGVSWEDPSSGADATAWHNGGDAYASKSIGTTGDEAFDVLTNSAKRMRFRPLLDFDGTTKIMNLLLGPQTTQSRDVDGAASDAKYILDIQRNHANSTYGWIGNATDAGHSAAGWVIRSTNAEMVLSCISPSDGFSDIRAGNDAAVQIGTGTHAFWLWTEGGSPINVALANTLQWTFAVDGGLNARGPSYADQNPVGGFLAFQNGITTYSELRLNAKPILTGIASPDGGANAMNVTGSHVCVGMDADDASTGRGLIARKSDGTVIGELFFYNNGTPMAQLYVGGVAGGNIVINTSYVSGAPRLSFFPGSTPVVQQTAVADAAGGAVIDAEARTAINALLARMRNYVLIAT